MLTLLSKKWQSKNIGRKFKKHYVEIKFTYDGKEHIVDDVPANVWEKEGSNIHVFYCSDDTIKRNLCVTYHEIIMLFCLTGYYIYELIQWHNRQYYKRLSTAKIIVNDYDSLLCEPTDQKKNSEDV